MRSVIVYVPTGVSRAVDTAPVVEFIVIVGYDPTPTPFFKICIIEYDRPDMIAGELDVPASTVDAATNDRRIPGDVAGPVTTVVVYGVCPIA